MRFSTAIAKKRSATLGSRIRGLFQSRPLSKLRPFFQKLNKREWKELTQDPE